MTAAQEHSDLVACARTLGDGWKQGEQRSIHRRRYMRRKPVPCRPSMLDPYIHIIEEWLAAAPQLPAVDLLSGLETHAPGRCSDHERRTVQRLVKNWRSTAARQLISSKEITHRSRLRSLVVNPQRFLRRTAASRSLATARFASGLLGLAVSNSADAKVRFDDIII
ncbi:hypothetical protein QA645_39605 [Bradyrhizobium sp. CIAT3101]|uniref:hypothetical protein n=1 Tax=Bradyrhizobium sp. CIAT3101 TaxID=439387 RepID=UPI0024B19A1A|nr:hypothetical protein [Bradyrhizobium sp. CIAT3101]WFU80512.1 hypothetical protein QA645_39605 [Bradyrhizobium sp. CIAT3101]